MMHKVLMGILIITSIVHGVDSNNTTTTAEFGIRSNLGQDTHGKYLYTQDVTLKTVNYKIDTFWKRFHNPDNKTNNASQVTTKGTVQLTVESSSGCSIAGKGELPAEGCSGQKPFLVNDGSVAGLADGASISLIFQPVYKDPPAVTGLYTDTSAEKMFYPLDIKRDENYYKNNVTLGAKKSFFSFFGDIFKVFFGFLSFTPTDSSSYLNNAVVKIDNVTSADDERQRYKANIIAGVQQKYLMAKGTNLNPGLLYTPVSLLHYKQKDKEANVASCQSAFWPMTMMCRMMTGFTSKFFTTTLLNKNTSGSAVKYDLITVDTENALLALAGKVAPAKVQATATSTPVSIFSGMFSWMSKMMSMMFGTTTATATTPVYADTNYQFTDSDAMTMTLAVTKDGGSTVDRFDTFKLMGIHSTNAAQGVGDETCTVEKKETTSSFFIFFPSGTVTSYDTFYKSKGTTGTDWSMKLQTGTVMFFIPVYTTYNTHQLWVSWCAAKGVGGSSVDGSKTYTVKSYNNNGVGLGRGLVLDLKKVTLTPADPLNTTTIKLINVKH